MAMSVATFYIGDALDVMRGLPDASFDLIVTSPPFLALRSYLPADHPDKGKEIGSEATPAAFLSTLLALTREWRRLLAPHGSLAVELGDTYSGSSQGGGDLIEGSGSIQHVKKLADVTAMTNGQPRKGPGWPLDKSLCLLPTLYPASLAYGRNLLHPDDVLEPWRIRNVIVWHRPNPPVGALGDKVRPSTSYVTVACMRRDRWFDLDAERTEHQHGTAVARGSYSHGDTGNRRAGGDDLYGDTVRDIALNPAGAPPLDHWTLDEDPAEHQSWTIPTQPYAGSHYATFPIALPRRLIRLMCPMHVCRTCGEPRRRIVEKTEAYQAFRERQLATISNGSNTVRDKVIMPTGFTNAGTAMNAEYETVGWSDCGHSDFRRGIVLDPFAGSGTTLAAATEQGRDAIGIDIDEDNYWLARQRIGMFLEEPA
jgi:DNA modification methylase